MEIFLKNFNYRCGYAKSPFCLINFRSISVLFLSFLLIISACSDNPGESKTENNRAITILYTNDEHGWIEESEESEGAAKLLGLWQDEEGYTKNGDFLILSGGDNFTGPAISTWFEGESMVEVMNAMEYDAAAIGNHEFDFTVENLRDRIEQADYPYLSANIFEKSTGQRADFAIPFVIKAVNDVTVGLIGLTTTTTSYSTFPAYVADYDFTDYTTALKEVVPQVLAEGADLLILVAHICYFELIDLVPLARELGISILGGGHCNDLVGEMIDGIAIIEGGKHLRSYAKVEIIFDIEMDSIIEIIPSVHNNQAGSPAPEIEAIVSLWKAKADAELSGIIGYVKEEINVHSPALYNLVTDSWLFAYPAAHISATNAGGIRQSIPLGNITKGTIVGVLPFQNNIIELELTGTQIIETTQNLIVGGLTRSNGYFLADNTPLQADSIYRILTTDYLYSRPDFNFSLYDPDPFYTGLNYSQPTIDYLIHLNTSAADPLDNYLDDTVR